MEPDDTARLDKTAVFEHLVGTMSRSLEPAGRGEWLTRYDDMYREPPWGSRVEADTWSGSGYQEVTPNSSLIRLAQNGGSAAPVGNNGICGFRRDFICNLNRVTEELYRNFNLPFEEFSRPFVTNLYFPGSVVFRFPYREDEDDQYWLAEDFVIMKGTRIRYQLDRWMEGEFEQRQVTMSFFVGDSSKRTGFAGPALSPHRGPHKDRDGDPQVPEKMQRILKIVFKEIFREGRAFPKYPIDDYSGRTQMLSYEARIWFNAYDQGEREPLGCGVGSRCYLWFKGLKAECEDEKTFRLVEANRQLFGVLGSAEGLGLGTYESGSRAVDLMHFMRHLWTHGAITTDGESDPRVPKVEGLK